MKNVFLPNIHNREFAPVDSFAPMERTVHSAILALLAHTAMLPGFARRLIVRHVCLVIIVIPLGCRSQLGAALRRFIAVEGRTCQCLRTASWATFVLLARTVLLAAHRHSCAHRGRTRMFLG